MKVGDRVRLSLRGKKDMCREKHYGDRIHLTHIVNCKEGTITSIYQSTMPRSFSVRWDGKLQAFAYDEWELSLIEEDK